MEREKKRSIKKGIVGSCVVDDRGGTRQNKEEKKEKKKKTTHKETRKREKNQKPPTHAPRRNDKNNPSKRQASKELKRQDRLKENQIPYFFPLFFSVRSKVEREIIRFEKLCGIGDNGLM
jgi:ATPase subunit of ABC transporter with duplicated ATPase domains